MNIPDPPAREEWGFLQDLREREVRHVIWDRKAMPGKELDLSGGIELQNAFPDADGALKTAFDDIMVFAGDVGISVREGGVPLRLVKVDKVDGFESYTMDVTEEDIELRAEDTEGMRRAIYYFEDQVAAQDGPFLPFGHTARKPWLRNRISRCFFGPIKRPPFNRDELMDDMDYYPDEYLNRLAHEGVNGLWLTVIFREIAETSFTPRDKDAPRRLATLQRTIVKCLRYGIKTWILAIEPKWLYADDPLAVEHPELLGCRTFDGKKDQYSFCTSTEVGQQYLFETMRDIFTQLPKLGGFLNISHGERVTSCLSFAPSNSDGTIPCPRCSKIPKWQVHYNTMNAMIKGIRAAGSDAEILSWLYQPYANSHRGNWVYELARHLPEGVTLQYNFESGAVRKQLSRSRIGGDYWLSYVGPTDIFSHLAENAKDAGNKLSAKIQVGCSHEIATVPFVSVPGLLYHKYRAMRECGCSSVMQCWYFGNYPGIMNRAAGELAFEEFMDTENDFLERLARPQWGRHAKTVSEAWALFTKGYADYPLSNDMQYYGPMHFGVVWPLFLNPEFKPLQPTWKPDFPPSGDSIGECLENHTLDEAMILSGRMSEFWHKGMERLSSLRKYFAENPDRLLDIGVSQAIDILFNSAHNIFSFYLHRRTYLDSASGIPQKRTALEAMRQIVLREIENSKAMLPLCAADSRLGFHSEAEAHQFCASRLEWRIKLLEELLEGPFADAQSTLESGSVPNNSAPFLADAPVYNLTKGEWICEEALKWRAYCDDAREEVVIEFESSVKSSVFEHVHLRIYDKYASRFPLQIIISKTSSSDFHDCAQIETAETDNGWRSTVRIPMFVWGAKPEFEPFLLLVLHSYQENNGTFHENSWPKLDGTLRHRLNLHACPANRCGLAQR
ncbi:MAG: hypothetical protein IJS15_03370, partial [Victivallales bacterium]|nr:hypothetical protein [Victivallales bacterium]